VPELLFEGPRSRVLRQSAAAGSSVVRKQLLGAGAVQRARAERQVLQRLATTPGVPRLAAGLQPPDALLLEDLGGIALPALLQAHKLSLPALLDLALPLLKSLGQIHRQGLVHHNLNPGNILLVGAQRQPVWTGFSLAGEGSAGGAAERALAVPAAYRAPEQTGRTARTADQRADLYAFGLILYECVTQRLPFSGQDPLQQMHDILALVPPAPSDIDASIPQALSQIIMRLLEKEPERRYQSAEGLAHDLQRLREQLRQGQSEGFALGEHDFAARLAAPAHPVGRQAELQVLHSSFIGAMQGNCRGLLVAGAPGVGKTTLINELRPLVAKHHGWFVGGKSDQYRQDLNTDAMRQAFLALGRLLLAEPEAELGQLRTRILAALGPNAGLMATINPEFALLLGVQPEMLTGDPVLTAQRVMRAGIDLLRVIATPARPLVMVIDDLQWAASSAMAFFDAVLSDERLRGFLLVGAYRDSEIDAAHPLAAMRARWQQLGIAAPPLIALQALAAPEQAALLAQMLRLAPEPAAQLAQAVAAHSAGNPFDTVEVVNALRNDGILVHSQGRWRWDAASIRRHVGSGEVIDLLGARLRRLPKRARQLLQVMACLGGEVELGRLGCAAGLQAPVLDARLALSLDAGLVQAGQAGEGAAVVRFRHDRVQQAAYGLLTPASRRRLHLVLARRLAASSQYAAYATEQYLPAVAAVRQAGERRQVAQLFHRSAAGLRVVNAALAERLLSTAVGLLEGAGACADDALGLALRIDRHAALYSLGRLEEADAVYGWIEAHAADMLECIDSVCVQINSLTNRNLVQQALALGLGMLARLGIVKPDILARDELARCLEAMAKHFDDDLQRPLADTEQVIQAAKLITRMMPGAYVHDESTYIWLVTQAMHLWATRGPCAELVGSIARACVASVAAYGDYRSGYDVARHVLTVSEGRGFDLHASRARYMLGFSASHWFEPLEHSVTNLQLARESLLRGGDLLGAYFTYGPMLAALQDCAPTLESCIGEIESAVAFGARTSTNVTAAIFAEYTRSAQVLGAISAAPGDSEDSLADGTVKPDHTAPWIYSLRALTAALLGDSAALAHYAAEAAPVGQRHSANFYVFAQLQTLQAFSLAEQIRALPAGQSAEGLLSQFDICRAWLSQRAADAPFNFSHLVHWIDAERAWAVGQRWAALGAFEAALGEVAARQRPWHAALIAERAGLFHLAQGLQSSGHPLLALARERYRAWGAAAKVRQLDQAYPFLQAQAAAPQAAAGAGVSSDAIDLLGIVRASQALGSETSLARLHARMAELLAEMTGATCVRIALWDDALARWQLPASDTQPAISAQDAGAAGLLPLSVLRYVERTGEPLVVEDATRDDRFASDPALRGAERCSLLAVPVRQQGSVRAMLLLENRLSRAAFSAQRLDAVMLITGQLAVSLANVQLYESLEQRVLERTQQLREAQSQLLVTARKAGMAEIANNVLHNVGNVLNSVNISAGLVAGKMRESKAQGLDKAVRLVKAHQADLGHFLTQDPKGKLLPGYLGKLAAALAGEQQEVLQELAALVASVNHIKDIVATQQSYAGSASLAEPVRLQDLLEDALRMNAGSLARHEVRVVQQVQELPALLLDKPRVVQILVNLIGNAKQAVAGVAGRAHEIALRVDVVQDQAQGQRLRIRVEDNGQGIAAQNVAKLFVHGFTTRKDGHGFGLHSCAMAAKEMGGTLTAHSPGPGQGAIFTLLLPLKTACEKAAQRLIHDD
jgi:predicted ATPase/signal transduction histidine kinase